MVLKECNIIKPILPYKIHQKSEVLLGLPWESDDKICSDIIIFKILFDKTQELKSHFMIIKSAHRFEDFGRGMLEWKIKIRNKLAELIQSFQVFFGQDVRIEIEHSITEISWDLINSFQKIKKSGFTIQIHSVSSRILCDQDQLFNSLGNQIFCLLNKGFNRERSLFPSNFWDNTKSTRIVASFGDFEIFKT